ncbi:DUF4259 domain-containing protein [Micromonospora chersina]|uniref:DUF4259 domain-containing protein n=1 Tax=Micromonospora chersina TaxID=47854 RepID=UPI00367DEC12
MSALIDPFDNDGAADLLDELREAPTGEVHELLASALHRVVDLGSDEYLEKDYAEAAIAAAAIVGAVRQGDSALVERRRLSGVDFGPVGDLVGPALAALSRVTSAESELFELWLDDGQERQLLDSVEGISAVLRGEI